jgi:hypothetical protein
MIRVFLCVALLIPSICSAQATLADVVEDSSDAVVPGVTVETSSPALIENTRTATTDGTAQYQIFGEGGITAAAPEGNSAELSALYATPQGQVNLLQPGRVYGERINQIDMRLGKGLTFGNRTRANIAVDVLNLSNANTPTSYQQNYGDGRQYLQPLTILNPRLARFNVTVEF